MGQTRSARQPKVFQVFLEMNESLLLGETVCEANLFSPNGFEAPQKFGIAANSRALERGRCRKR